MKKKTELFVSIITLISVVVILIPSAFSLTSTQLNTIYTFDLIVVVILALDFYVRLRESGQGSRFVLTHCYELPAMLPLILLATLEQDLSFIGAAAIRSLRLIGLFRLVRLFFRTIKFFEARRIFYIAAFSAMAITFGAVAEYLVESTDPEAKITNIEDAFWWAIVTVTTVGYGDMYPVTAGGRIVASLLMIGGIAILGILISTLGAGLIESRFRKEDKRGKSTVEPSLTDQTKMLIKGKIDRIEDISQDDFNNLMTTIKNLRNMSHE